MAKSVGLHALTARGVLTAKDGRHGDGGGLWLQVADGRGTWAFMFTSPTTGKRREMGMGPCHRVDVGAAGASLKAARDAAHLARELIRGGVDPIADRDARREAARAAEAERRAGQTLQHWTLARCARDYHERVIEPSRTPKHAAQWLASLENHMPPAVWHRPIGEVTAPELLQALLSIKPHQRARNVKAGTMAETVSRLRQRLDAVFEDAAFFQRCTGNPAAAIRRKMGEQGPRAKVEPHRSLPYKEIRPFVAQLRQQEGIAARCLEFALLTAARTGEALGARWSEFDLDAGRWLVPAERMKADEDHEVLLPARAVAIVRQMAELGLDPELVFGKAGGGELSNMALLAVLDRMGMRSRTTVHGLRATFSTWANETAAARPDVIEAALAHQEADRVRAAYNRAGFAEERRALLAAWADVCEPGPGADVIPLKAA